ncbi:MAG: hypothetical protein JXR30_04150, partial [Alphaproteobacteria bacterium]|nr:hypothetical protein [Alphaproteobacteria bacterium]
MKWQSFSLGEDLTDHLRARFKKTSEEENKVFHRRIRWLNRIVFVVFCLIVLKLLSLSAPRNLSLSFFDKKQESWKTSFLSRADIIDRKGEMLATNLPIYNLAVRPTKIENKQQFATELAEKITGLSVKEILSKIQTKKKYIYLKKSLSEKEYRALKNLRVEEIELEKIDRRKYPKKNIFAHMIGFTDTDNKGLKGLEYGLDSEIREDPNTPFKLACDLRFQEIIHTVLEAGVKKYQAKGGGAILMKTDTGEILSFVSLPDFDPNELGKYPVGNRFNKLTSGVYEPGSVFKLFNMAIALEEGIPEDKLYEVQTPLKVGRFQINDIHKVEE